MRVAFGRDGGEPQPTRIALIAPCRRHQRAGINTFTVAADGLLPIRASTHLRFGFKPIVKIEPIFSAAEFVKLVGALPNFLLHLFGRVSQLPFSTRCGAPLLHSGVPPFS